MQREWINNDWFYSPDYLESYIESGKIEASFEAVRLPHTNVELPFNNFDEKTYQFVSCYKRWLDVPEMNEDEKVYIRFEGVMSNAKVYLNGHFIGEHRTGYTSFRFDLTPYLAAENLLTVVVDSTERPDTPPFGFVIDYLTYGGIYREVSLDVVNECHIEHMFIKPRDVLTDPKAKVEIQFSKESNGLELDFELSDGRRFVKKTEGQKRVTFILDTPEIDLWSLESPVLYDLSVTVRNTENVIDCRRERFGYRQAQFKSDGFYLNDKKIKIRGLNRHQSYPYVGYAMPKSAQVKDADILKEELGVNMVRLSHYPQSRHFLDRCDEIGLLVFDEIPGWQHIGDEDWQSVSLKTVSEMIADGMNHPSIVIWGTRINESQDCSDFYRATSDLARSMDDTRATGGVRCIKNSELLEDVYTYNDFVFSGRNQPLDRKKDVTSTDKPYMVTEFNGHMFPTKKYDCESKRTEQANRHLKVLDAMMGDNQINGAIGWCMFDYNTHKDFGSGDKICYHGVMDMFRIPKTASYAYGSQQSRTPVMHVANTLNIGEYEASLLEDIYIYTNCDYVDFYKNNKYVKRFYSAGDQFPHLDHPPVIIDDFIGDEIEKNERFSKRDAAIVKQLLAGVSRNGTDMKFMDKLRMLYIFVKYKMNQLDAEDLYTKYFGGWGGESNSYRFVGSKDGESITVVKGQVSEPVLDVTCDSDVLAEGDSYDVMRTVVKLIDDNGEPIAYANDSIQLNTEGPIEIIGPKHISLVGGSVGFWIKTTGNTGEAAITVASERFGKIVKKLKIFKGEDNA